ncbi:thiamine transporter 1 [Culex quinquefasciatus]|nr:thiamine transporter 1 [Culex quinquefasciatus]
MRDIKWHTIAAMLSMFGFLKDFRPSDPFIVQFLNSSWHNLTKEQITQDLFPVGTYSYGTQLVFTFLITDYFRYKPLIILAGIAGILHWGLFIWGPSIFWLQVAQVLYGTFKAADVAFWSYIYARVEKCRYQKITSYTKSASLLGKFGAAVGSQILLAYGVVDYRDLFLISFAVQCCTTTIAIFLPSAPKSVYFNRAPPEKSDSPDQSTDSPEKPPRTSVSSEGTESPTDPPVEHLGPLQLLWFHVRAAYSNFTVLRYSIWSALASCIYYQTMQYVQVLWSTVAGVRTRDLQYNGAVEAVLTMCGALITFSAGFVPSRALKVPNSLVGLGWITLLQGGILLGAALGHNLWICYGAHIGYSVLHSFVMTLLSAEIAKNICRDSFGLVFGINAAVGSILQIIFTLILVDGAKLFHRDIIGQFMVYSGVLGVLGVLFCVFAIVELRGVWRRLFSTFLWKISGKEKSKLNGTVCSVPGV